MKIRKTREDRIVDAVAIVLSVIVFLICVYPIYYCLINSFNEGKDAARRKRLFIPQEFYAGQLQGGLSQ